MGDICFGWFDINLCHARGKSLKIKCTYALLCTNTDKYTVITKGGKGGKFQPSSERGVVSNHGQWYELYRGNILYMGMSTQNVMLNEGVKISTTSCVTILHTFLCFAKVCIFFIHLKINLAQKECIYTQKLVEDVHQCL